MFSAFMNNIFSFFISLSLSLSLSISLSSLSILSLSLLSLLSPLSLSLPPSIYQCGIFNSCAVFILGCALMVFGVFLDPRQENVILHIHISNFIHGDNMDQLRIFWKLHFKIQIYIITFTTRWLQSSTICYLTNLNIYIYIYIYICSHVFSLGFISTYSEITIITIKNTFCQSLEFLELKKKMFFNNVT